MEVLALSKKEKWKSGLNAPCSQWSLSPVEVPCLALQEPVFVSDLQRQTFPIVSPEGLPAPPAVFSRIHQAPVLTGRTQKGY